MSNLPSVGQSASVELLFYSAKRTHVEYSTEKYTAPPKLKQMCVGSSDKRIGCIYHQFSYNLEEALNFVTYAIGDGYVTVEPNNLKKVTYLMFNKIEKAEIFVKTPTIYNGRPAGAYEIVKYDNNVTIVKIQNFLGVAMSDIISSLNRNLSPIGTITDINADPQAEITNLLEFENIVVLITYNGSVSTTETEKTAKKSSKNKTKQAELSSTKIMQEKISNFFGTENSESKKILIKPLADVPDTNNQNTYAEEKQKHEITLELSDQSNIFGNSCSLTPNFKKEWGESDGYKANNDYPEIFIDINLVGKLANNIIIIADSKMQ
ncbi:hypothetical protein BB561_005164 [Smittium simulii]|uniref:Uncharacterized protein n=1 Tax=Smittium simulii TaxID=133385 RepID=A0A2T9YBT6_9FUNG|nr:hypothetical protein BB561_005164 [Smittium simulii]